MGPAADQLPTSMRAFRLTSWQQPPELVEVAVPEPGPGQVLVRVAGNGLCHSDITMMEMPGEFGEALGWAMPFTLGHEASGWIAAVGEDASLPDGLRVGDAVALMSSNSCGVCRFCRSGRDSLCESNMVGRGFGRDGGLAEFVLAGAGEVLAIGDLDPVTAGTLTDAGATSFHAVSRVMGRLSGLGVERPSVLVIGAGGLGGFCVQIAAAMGAGRIVAVDPDESRRQRALRLGATDVVAGVERGTRRELSALVGADGFDGVLDVVGTDETIDCGIRTLSRGGVFSLVGAGGGTLQRPWFSTLPYEAEIFTFQGSGRAHVEGVIELARRGEVMVEAERFPLSDVATAYARLHDGTLGGRAVVVPD